MTPGRFSSIGYQWKLAVNTKSTTYLEIGIGSGILTSLLRAMDFRVTTLDVNRNLLPMIVGRVPELPFAQKSFDVTVCYEVLEHLPFEILGECIKEIRRVTSHMIIISLPNQSTYERNGIRSKLVTLVKKIRNQKRRLPEEHFWEIGHNNVKVSDILDIAFSNQLFPIENFRNPHLPYHHFFVFSVNPNEE